MQGRSLFVTVTGWVIAVVAGLGAFYCLLFLFLPQDQLMGMVQQQQAAMPKGMAVPDAATLAQLMRSVMFGIFVVLAWALLSGLGLIKRKPWARISCLVLLVFGIVLGLLYLLIGLAAGSLPAAAAAGQGRLGAMMILGAAFAALCGVILYLLNTAKVKQEFGAMPKS